MPDRPVADPEAAWAWLRQIVNDASDAIVTIDEHQHIVWFNAAATEMFGYPRAEIVGRHLGILLPEAVRDRHEGHVVGFAAGRDARRVMSERDTLEGRRRDGSRFPVEITISRTEVGAERYLTAIVRDVSVRREAEAALRQSERRLRALVEHAPEMVAIIDDRNRVRYSSPGSLALFGFSPETIVESGATLLTVVHADDRAGLEDALARARHAPGTPVGFEGRGRTADGRWRTFSMTINDLSADDAVGGTVFNILDVTDARAVTTREAALAELGRSALDATPLATLSSDALALVARLLDVDATMLAEPLDDDDGATLVVRYAAGVAEPLVGRTFRPPSAWASAVRAGEAFDPLAAGDPGLPPLTDTGIVAGLTAAVAAKGEIVAVLGVYTTSPRTFRPDEVDFLDGVAHVLASAVERRRFERDLEHQTLHDPLTGLPNRVLLRDRLTHALTSVARHSTSVAVLMVDLDDFKLVNDSMGHSAGDELLRVIARRLAGAVRASDTVARFGGDEFVVVTETQDELAESMEVAQRLLEVVRLPVVIDDREVFVTASVGVAIVGVDDRDGDVAVSEADIAMYRAKQGGDRFVVFDEALRAGVRDRLVLAQQLRQAMELGELRTYFQPEVDLATGRVAGAEALLRWARADGRVEPADRFLVAALDSGLIVPIGAATIADVCARARAWSAELGADAPTCTWINLAARQVLDDQLLPTVAAALAESGVTPSSIGFEITESVLIDDLDVAAAHLDGLRALGVRLCLDDFGTGYASLTYLQRFAFDCLKIDKSFVAELDGEDDDARRMVAAVIDLAHGLGLQVTAEGVEAETQAHALRELGCDYAQGFLYAPAVPAPDFEEYVRARDGG